LTTTVLGLVDAIPASYRLHYLKNSMRDFRVDMEGFIAMLLSAVEMEDGMRSLGVLMPMQMPSPP